MHFLSDTLPPLIETWDKTPKDLWDKSDVYAQWAMVGASLLGSVVTFMAFLAAWGAYRKQAQEVALLKGQLAASRRAVRPVFKHASKPKFVVSLSKYPYKEAGTLGTLWWRGGKEPSTIHPGRFVIPLENYVPNTDPVQIYAVKTNGPEDIEIRADVHRAYAALADTVRYEFFLFVLESPRAEFAPGEVLNLKLVVQTSAGYIEETAATFNLPVGELKLKRKITTKPHSPPPFLRFWGRKAASASN